MNKVYIGTLERFGYELTVICKTEQECKDLLLKKYEETYKNRNENCDPREDIAYDRGYEDKTYYELAEEDIYITEMELNKVEWR